MFDISLTLSVFALHRDAWKKLEGTSKEEAREKYVNKLVEVCGHVLLFLRRAVELTKFVPDNSFSRARMTQIRRSTWRS